MDHRQFHFSVLSVYQWPQWFQRRSVVEPLKH